MGSPILKQLISEAIHIESWSICGFYQLVQQNEPINVNIELWIVNQWADPFSGEHHSCFNCVITEKIIPVCLAVDRTLGKSG